jgi:hypothetical protein
LNFELPLGLELCNDPVLTVAHALYVFD